MEELIWGDMFFVQPPNKDCLLSSNARLVLSSEKYISGHISVCLSRESAGYFYLFKKYRTWLEIPFPEKSWKSVPEVGAVFSIGIQDTVGYFIFEGLKKESGVHPQKPDNQ